MERLAILKQIWEALPKTVKVFFYLAVSIILSESLIELANMEQGFLVRVLAQLINLGLVLTGEVTPIIKNRLSK